MKYYSYIKENSRTAKIKTLIISAFLLLLFLFLGVFLYTYWIDFIKDTPLLYRIASSLKYNVVNTTPLGLFYGHFLGGIFVVPSADELIFYYGLLRGNSIIFSVIAALSGYMLAQILNYILGSKVSGVILHLVSKKKVYKTKRFVNRYGAYGIFIFNVLPLPAPLLTFALGITKYNFKRLFLITFIAKVVSYAVIIGFFLLFSG